MGMETLWLGPPHTHTHTHTHTLAYWTESNGPAPGGNGPSLRVSVRARWHPCIHLSMLPPSLFDVTSPLDFQWAPTP